MHISKGLIHINRFLILLCFASSFNYNFFNSFQGGPYYDILHCLLGAYVCYRPDVGYVQGMSFIAAILILNLEAADAFICFSNLLNRPCHMAFFSLNQSLVSINKNVQVCEGLLNGIVIKFLLEILPLNPCCLLFKTIFLLNFF